MSTKKLFDEDSEEEEVSFKTENEYAKKYDNWREKEELHKLEQKYGSKALTEDPSLSSESEDDDDEPPEVSEEVETQFLKTLALLKTKDPRIYDSSFKAFEEKEEKKEENKPASKTLTFEDSDDSDSGDDGNIFKVEKKAEIATESEKKGRQEEKKTGKETKIKEYLIGKVEHIDDEVEQDLAPLKALWSDPKLNEGEAFLRDYILNKRYLDDGDLGDAEDKRDDEDLEEDERRVEEQGKFERAYNFRFEEPDDEFLKRYPRTMNYTRPKDDRRSKKRAEVRSRKEEEKKKKMEEIARLKALKLKEIQEKIAKIKEVTGNQDLAFKEDDIEGDFDPEEHDKRMKALFDEEFYGEADDQKPVFPDLDEELEIENWDKYEPDLERENTQYGQNNDDDGPHCEDEDFNMDADYDPKQAKAKLIEEIQSTLGKKRRNRKKKSKLAEILATHKPKYIPEVVDKTYDQYMEEYYKMDCEDVIGGDLPTRFKYREVVPNDFGLTIEEILLADDKELTQWVPLKKIVKHRPKDVEKSEINTYRQKAADERLKKKILPSLFKNLPEEPELVVPIEEATKKKKKKKKNKDKKIEEDMSENTQEIETIADDNSKVNGDIEDNIEVKSKKKKRKHEETTNNADEVNVVVKKSQKQKHKQSEETLEVNVDVNEEINKKERKDSQSSAADIGTTEASHKKKKKNKNKQNITENKITSDVKVVQNKGKDSESSVADKDTTEATHKKKKKNKNKQNITENKITSDVKTVQNSVQKVDATKIEVHSQVTETSKNKKKRKKKNKSNGFVVENVQKQGPSNTGQEGIKTDTQKPNLKRKLDNSDQGPNKKQKKFDFSKNKGNKGKNKFTQSKNRQSKDQSSDNPMNKLSDERLKAYGLNPKKYRSFLKYKKH